MQLLQVVRAFGVTAAANHSSSGSRDAKCCVSTAAFFYGVPLTINGRSQANIFNVQGKISSIEGISDSRLNLRLQ